MKIHGTYEIHVGNYDWGCSVDRAVLTLERPLPKLCAESFAVTEKRMTRDFFSGVSTPYEESTVRRVAGISKIDEQGTKIALDLAVSPAEGSPLFCTGDAQINIWSNPYQLLITYANDIELDIEPSYTKRTTDADHFTQKEFTASDGTFYRYAEYIPTGETRTLYVWLHGLGEGQHKENDALIPVLARNGTSMSADAFQDTIGGARVLVPQCPTYWMDNDGAMSNLNNSHILADGTSHYTESLEELIDTYAEEMKAAHIILAGCSNGGYMSVLLAARRPDRYCAVVPICEAMPDSCLSDADILALAKVPLYFVYANEDPIVVPTLHEIPTIERLRAAGAEELHVSVTDKVLDTSGKYKDAGGNPFEYFAHCSWIHYDNNFTDDGDNLDAWNWILKMINS